jgi:hypothetical protein
MKEELLLNMMDQLHLQFHLGPTPSHKGKAKRWYMAYNKKIRFIK